ncbi:hypothetical protein BX600DRAFT_382626 [Xylariales sp. PMI_506]|nr:hypothetical protein BX600DRAFT_382626 [Xylariales sp. PMI_506]
MKQPSQEPENVCGKSFQRIYRSVGFTKAYNFVLFCILVGALMGFTLARLSFLDLYGVLCRPSDSIISTNSAGPGECFYLLRTLYAAGITIHLAAILPAAFLACFQFVPVIRHKIILVHRVNGYMIMLLSIIAVAGALIITRHTYGGGLDVQSAIGFLSIIFLGATFMAYLNIKKLQIDQHRAWMIRAWVYAGSAITTRFILYSGIAIITRLGDFFTAMPCAEIDWLLVDQELTTSMYPSCITFYNGSNPMQQVAVQGALDGDLSEVTAAYDLTFGTAHWIALVIHIIGVEIYLKLTPEENMRLKRVSYQRQLDAAMKYPD